MKLSRQDRSAYRRTLNKAGIKTAGLNDEALHSRWEKATDSGSRTLPDQETTIPIPDKPVTPSKPASKPSKSKATPSKGNGEKAPERDSTQSKPTSRTLPKASTGLEAAIQELIDLQLQGFNPENHFDEAQIIELIERHSKAEQVVKHIVEQARPDNMPPLVIENAHPQLPKVLDIVSKLKGNAYLVGEAGCGKTHLASQVADFLEVDFHFCGAIFDKFELLGFVDAGGKYHRTPLREAIEHGGVFLIDEVDSSMPAPLNAFNMMLENNLITFPDGESFAVDRDKTFFLAAANTIGLGANMQYVGRFQLDAAFLDRFKQVRMAYDPAIELELAKNAWLKIGGLPEHIYNAESWVKTVQDFRKLLADREILALCTPRASRDGAALLAIGWTEKEVKETELYKHLTHDMRMQLGLGAVA